MPEICLRYTREIPEICLIFLRDLFKICIKFVRYIMPEICLIRSILQILAPGYAVSRNAQKSFNIVSK